MSTVEQRAIDWIGSGDTGMSSKAIWAHMMGGKKPRDGWNHPYDPDDLGRCLRLLRLIPEWKPRMKGMAKRSKDWAALVKHWDELAAMMDAEVGLDWEKARRAPLTYGRMCEILYPGRQAA